jgi:hypothetical protein
MDTLKIKNFPKDGKIQVVKGNTYVILRKYIWDKEKKATTEVRETLGKVVDDVFYTTEEYKRLFKRGGVKRKYPLLEPFNSVKLTASEEELIVDEIIPSINFGFVGAIPILYSIAYKQKLWDDLCEIYNKDIAKYVLGLATYFICQEKNCARKFEGWCKNRLLPKDIALSSQEISNLYHTIGEDHQRLSAYTYKRIQRISKSDLLISIDTTTVASEAIEMEGSAIGLNKHKYYEMQYNVTVIFDNNTRQPIMYRAAPGNVADISTVEDSMLCLSEYGLTNDVISAIFDRGYGSFRNLIVTAENNLKCLVAFKTNNKEVRRVIDNSRSKLVENSIDYIIPGGGGIAGITEQISILNENTNTPIKLYIHVFYSAYNANYKASELKIDIENFENNWKIVEDKTPLRKLPIFKLFIEENNEIKLNKSAFDEELKYEGFFSSITNYECSATDAYKVYEMRADIEQVFKSGKQHIDLNTPRVHSDKAFQGKLFVNMISLAIIQALKVELAKERYKLTTKLNKQVLDIKSNQYNVSDVINDLETIYYRSFQKLGVLKYSEVTVKQHNLAKACGCEDIYKREVFSFLN